MTEAQHPKLEELIAVLERLRAPNGCAWDRDQTHASLVRYLIEETYELVDAIETRSQSADDAELIEELGDVLYQVIFHSDIAAEAGRFTLEDVAAHMTAKMIGRHPHVFGDRVAETPEAVMEFWEDLKREEKPLRSSTLDGVPQGMPSLLLADKLLGKGGAVAPAGSWASEEALGDFLLSTVAAARSQGFDAERALRGALRGLQEQIRAGE
jgi:XTP/dITP diphosphohydrolase